MAQGEYVWFVDADDQIDSTFIERAISLLKKGTSHGNQWDWLVFGSLNIFASGNTTSHALQNDLRLETRKQFHNHFDDIFSQLPYNVPWNKFFKRTIIMEHRLSFPPMTTGEDAAFITSYLPYVNTCCVLAETPYYYQLESSSSMRSTHRALKEYQDNRNRIFSQTKTFQRLGLKSDKVTSESVYRLIYGTYILLYQSVHNKQNSLKVFLRSTHALPGLTEFLALAENLPMTPRIRILRFFVQHPFAFYLYYQIRSAR
ncbi:hypothetical protein F7D08_1170 [Bifidobacterium cebidarum]|uniref:Glycosyltransferase 2-like domain-containing protein n=2 Tax=Bifidobacterium cebidarum TaxID=2650773 RepID=A0A6I1G919_9BIFI|nr:hypothetical protein F7D08_1170 [Bifidobacterium cebidarum]